MQVRSTHLLFLTLGFCSGSAHASKDTGLIATPFLLSLFIGGVAGLAIGASIRLRGRNSRAVKRALGFGFGALVIFGVVPWVPLFGPEGVVLGLLVCLVPGLLGIVLGDLLAKPFSLRMKRDS